MEDHNLHFPSTIQEALDFYIKLKTAMNIEMDRVNYSELNVPFLRCYTYKLLFTSLKTIIPQQFTSIVV